MPRLDSSKRFAEKRSNTEPVVRLPRNIKDALGIDQAYVNGMFKIEPFDGMALYDCCYIFEDINYKSQDNDKKVSTLLEVMKLFKSMDSQYKITVANEQRDMTVFMQEIFQPIHGEEYPEIEEGIGAWINQKIEEGTRDIRRLLYLTVTCRAKSLEEAKIHFATLDTTLRQIFFLLRSRIYRMSGVERLLVLQRMLRAGEVGIPITEDALKRGRQSWKNRILPAYIGQEKDYMEINNRFACVLFGYDYDQTLNEEKVLHSLTDMTFPTYITLDIEPIRRHLLKDKLQVAHTNNERAISQEQIRHNSVGQYTLEPSYPLKKKKTELEDMMDQVEENDEEALYLGLLVYVYADSLEELDQHVDTLKHAARGAGYELDVYYYRQLKALNTVLPIGGRQVNHMCAILTSSAVAFQPFYAKDLQQLGGKVYGMNQITKQLLSADRKKLKASHGIIVGHTGSGKSFFEKVTDIAQTLLFTDDDIIVIDPKNEQQGIINQWGQYFDLTPQCEIYLNPYEVPRKVWEGDRVVKNRFIAKQIEYAVSFAAAVMTGLNVNQIHVNYISRAVRKMYQDYFEQKNWKKQPTKTKLWGIIKQMAEETTDPQERRLILDIADSMEEYVIGVYDMFAHPANLDMHNRLIGFGLNNLPSSVWEAAMVSIMHVLSMRIEENQEILRATSLIVDEAQVMAEHETSAAQLVRAVLLYRQFGATITLLVQNLTKVLEIPDLRDIFSNCPYKVFFDQGGVDAANLAKIQELSTEEYQALERNEVGNCLFVWDGEVYLLDARMSKDNELYDLFNTDFHEKAKNQKMLQEQKPVIKV